MSKHLMAVCAAPLVATRAAYSAFHPPRTAQRRRPDQFGLQAEELTIAAPGRTRLSAWLCRGDPGRVVLLGHGLGLEKSRSLPYARFLHRGGYTVLLFDFRNHGDSSQDRGFAGFDRRFAEDAVAAATHLRAMPEFAEARLALYGFSLSSFAMLRALAALHGAVDAVVCDSGPACDPPAISPNLLRSGLLPVPAVMREAPARPVVEYVFRMLNHITMGASGDWPPTPDRPAYATTPMLFIAGGADSVVPADEILRLARPYPRAETLVVPGAKHLRAMWTDKDQYTSTVLEFLERCLDPTKAVR
ncbi:alpha/beta fold hydrolase [Streptomyces sp. NPDC002668]|uniref:alpha/beta hydrolase n=1 Tax=Streptomyces sp. NPDC002668 TaxID=3154422 RepID=UPI003316F818